MSQTELASTYHSNHMRIDTPGVLAEANSTMHEIIEELEWHRIFNTPHVRRGLRNLAQEALQEFAKGETEVRGIEKEAKERNA